MQQWFRAEHVDPFQEPNFVFSPTSVIMRLITKFGRHFWILQSIIDIRDDRSIVFEIGTL